MYLYLPNPGQLGQNHLDKNLIQHFFSLRVKTGDVVKTTNLAGEINLIKIIEINKKSRVINYELIEKIITKKPKKKNILIQAIIDKLYLEKLVEILPLGGIDKLFLFISDYSPKQKINLERLDKILIRSCEQSETTWKPEIKIITKSEIQSILQKFEPGVLHIYEMQNYLLGIEDDKKSKKFNPKNKQFNLFHDSIIVGPEGGWSNTEIQNFQNLGLDFIFLGKKVLPAWIAGFSYFSQKQDKT